PPGQDMKLPAQDGTNRLTLNSQLVPPYGDYVFKLVATDAPADFRPLAFEAAGRCERAQGTRGSCEGLACLFNSMGPKTRGTSWGAARPRWTTQTGHFSVVKP
ncbi:MAG: hypothetical protein QF464_09075, partial [Myxococcota bacterium]|nr:hypothetical protein [Myxococcota bacterium]